MSIQAAGVNEADFLAKVDELAVVDAFDDQCTGANPRYPLITELKRIYLLTTVKLSLKVKLSKVLL